MAMNNTSTKKKSASMKPAPVQASRPTKDVHYTNHAPVYKGQLSGSNQGLADPLNKGVTAKIEGLDGLHDDIGEKSGFITDGYIDKGGTPFGEDAKFNYLPPGMDINNQAMLEVHAMPLREIVESSYPGDGWMPKPRDIAE